jgi:hypothetical protein
MSARVASSMTGVPGALLMILLGTAFGIVTFGVLTANVALRSRDPAVQAILPMAYLLILLTSAYRQSEQIDSPVVRAIVDATRRARPASDAQLMLSGYDWGHIGIALAVLVGLG